MFSRKRILIILALVLLLIPSALTQDTVFFQDGVLSLYNTHSDEYMTIRYLDDYGRIEPMALDKISYMLRSPETNEIKPIDPHLVLVLDRIQDHFGPDKTIEVICGYRSPFYNAKLRSRSEGVAKNSFHMQAKAADIAIAGVDLGEICKYSQALQQGGVGFYPDRFIHVDVGPVRFW